jgi:hypothetical protein
MSKAFKISSVIMVALLLLITLVACGNKSTPMTTPTPTPTPSASPTATSQPTATPLTGWKKFTGDGVELWLPDTFEGGNLSSADFKTMMDNAKMLFPSMNQTFQMMEQNPSILAFFAFDTHINHNGSLTEVTIAKEEVPSAMSIDTYMNAAKGQFPQGMNLTDTRVISLGDRQVGQMTVEMTVLGKQVNELFCIFKENNTMWDVVFATGASEFAERLPDFNRSASTFTILP